MGNGKETLSSWTSCRVASISREASTMRSFFGKIRLAVVETSRIANSDPIREIRHLSNVGEGEYMPCDVACSGFT